MGLDNVLLSEEMHDTEAPFLLNVFCQCPEALADSKESLVYQRDNLAHTNAHPFTETPGLWE